MKLKLLRLAEWFLLRARFPFIGRFGRTPAWVLNIRLVPLKWTVAVAEKIEKLEEGQC